MGFAGDVRSQRALAQWNRDRRWWGPRQHWRRRRPAL